MIPKSTLAKRIEKARHAKQASLDKPLPPIDAKEAEQVRRERIREKFLREEEQWKRDALVDMEKRVLETVKKLGI